MNVNTTKPYTYTTIPHFITSADLNTTGEIDTTGKLDTAGEEDKSWWEKTLNLIYIDFQNSYQFIIQNKNFIIWSIILVILLQFTSITNLGSTFNKYCNHDKKSYSTSLKKQKGGEGSIPNAASGAQSGMPTAAQAQNSLASLLGGKSGESELQKTDRQLGFFQKLKGNFGAGGKYGGKYGIAGPVFGNFDKIMDSVRYIFYILFIILTVAGVLSIPVLIYIILTYVVIKFIVSKFAGL